MLARIEIRVEVDTIQNIGYELLQEKAGGNADFPSQASGHSFGEAPYIFIVHTLAHALSVRAVRTINVADPESNRYQGRLLEWREPDLRCPRIVESRIGSEIHMQALGQWGQSLYTLRAVKERRRARRH